MASNSNVDEALRLAVITPLQNKQPQLAKFLTEACWTWQSENQNLSITVRSPQVQEQLKNSNSLLLRFFQRVLIGTELATIIKLSFSNQASILGPERQNKAPGPQPQGQSNANTFAPNRRPETEASPPAPAGQTRATPGERETQMLALNQTGQMQARGKQNHPAMAQRIIREQQLEDYSQLPADIQKLQKVLLAQVKEVHYSADDRKTE